METSTIIHVVKIVRAVDASCKHLLLSTCAAKICLWKTLQRCRYSFMYNLRIEKIFISAVGYRRKTHGVVGQMRIFAALN